MARRHRRMRILLLRGPERFLLPESSESFSGEATKDRKRSSASGIAGRGDDSLSRRRWNVSQIEKSSGDVISTSSRAEADVADATRPQCPLPCAWSRDAEPRRRLMGRRIAYAPVVSSTKPIPGPHSSETCAPTARSGRGRRRAYRQCRFRPIKRGLKPHRHRRHLPHCPKLPKGELEARVPPPLWRPRRGR